MLTHLLAITALALAQAKPPSPPTQATPGSTLATIPSPPPASPLEGLTYAPEFFPGARHNPQTPTPDSVLGFPVGSRAATHAQIEAVIKAIAANSPRCRLVEYGRSHEGRTLYYLVIASEERIRGLEGLKADLNKLADPRTVGAEEADRLARTLPAVAWMSYVIHGDEMSGSDASLALAHHLAAGEDEDVRVLLDNLVVIIDPLMNPDGRDRFLTMLAQNRTAQPSVDDQSLLHTGFWPAGRMNHYLFDMNRDWIFGTQPETRGRLKAIKEWKPHYFMESHEMGSQDTFLFMPGREALNPNLPGNVTKWESRFATDLAKAFDAKGWRYYTGEWNDNWYPGYSSSWAALGGMVENLYEQARIQTDAVRRPEGTLEAYREAVHKQLVASLANLNFLARNRGEVIADYLAEKRACLAPEAPHASRTFAIVPRGDESRVRRFLDLMELQGFDALEAGKPFRATGKDRLGIAFAGREFPAGTILVPNRHPLARLISAMLEFDPRMRDSFLVDERRELLRFNRSLIYDITGWSIPMMFDLDAFELSTDPRTAAEAGPARPPAPANAPAPRGGPAATPSLDALVALVIDGADDGAVIAAGRLMERGVSVRIAAKPFRFDDRPFARGSVLVTRKDNPGNAELGATVAAVCQQAGVQPVGVRSGLGPGDLPDLGGEHFLLLTPPRIAVLAREPFGPYSYGAAWHTIDQVLGLRCSYLDFARIDGADLRRYNVIIVPDGHPAAVAGKLADLRTWVQGGGTLIAIGASAAALAKEKDGLGSARVLSDVLAKPEPYIQAVIREWEGLSNTPDPARVWAYGPPAGGGGGGGGGAGGVEFPWDGAGGDDKPSEDELKRRDEWRKLFMPVGTLLAGRVDDRSWLTAGMGAYVPVMQQGEAVLVTPPGVQAAVRLGVFAPAQAPLPAPAQAPGAAPKGPADAQPGGDRAGEAKAGKAGEEPKKPKPGWMIAPPGQEMRLRMSGLLWPEAAERLANSTWLAREGVGAGQVILFAGEPNFRAATLGTSRAFMNAVVCGPGMGANQPIKLKHEE